MAAESGQSRSLATVSSTVGVLVLVLAAMVTLALSTRGNESGSPPSPRGYPSLPVETFVGTIDVGSVPEALRRQVTVSAADAVNAAEDNFSEGRRLGEPAVGLGSVSFDASRGLPVEAGTSDSSYTDRVAWVVVYSNSTPDLHGPAEMVARAPHYTCNLVLVVDALAGAGVIDVQQVCQQ